MLYSGSWEVEDMETKTRNVTPLLTVTQLSMLEWSELQSTWL